MSFSGPSSMSTYAKHHPTSPAFPTNTSAHQCLNMNGTKLKAAILVISTTASGDPSTDKCIPVLKETFDRLGHDQWDVTISEIVPDSIQDIQKFVRTWTDKEDAVNLIVTSGGTGFAVKDLTPEVFILA
jgi:gephyrin